MLLLNSDLWETDFILKIQSSSKWDSPDSSILTNCILEQIKSLLRETADTENEGILIIDLSHGNFPPWREALKIAQFFSKIRNLIVNSLNCTIIYAPTKKQRKWMRRILMLYTPAKPVYIVKTKKEIRQYISPRKKKLTQIAI